MHTAYIKGAVSSQGPEDCTRMTFHTREEEDIVQIYSGDIRQQVGWRVK